MRNRRRRICFSLHLDFETLRILKFAKDRRCGEFEGINFDRIFRTSSGHVDQVFKVLWLTIISGELYIISRKVNSRERKVLSAFNTFVFRIAKVG